MIHCEELVLIRRSAHNIFEFLANPDNNAVWRSAVNASWKLSPGPVQLGSSYAEKMRLVRQTLEATYKVTLFVPEQKFPAESESEGTWIRVSYDLVKLDEGINVKFSIEVRFFGVMTIVEPVARSMFTNDMSVDMAQLKRIMENTAILSAFDEPYDGMTAALGQ